jgi:molybdate transport system regulatory protein
VVIEENRLTRGILMKLKPRINLWLENENGYVFGEDAFKLLSKVQELGTLEGAVRELHVSYSYGWATRKRIESRIGKPLLKTHKGGTSGGGAELTAEAKALMKEYLEIKEKLTEVVRAFEFL